MDIQKLQNEYRAMSEKLIAAQEQANKAQLAKEAAQSKINNSAKAVTKYLSQLVERQLVTGQVQPKVVKEYLKRFNGDKQAEYLRVVAMLLTNQYTGITSEGTQISGSKFQWQGEQYDLNELYDHLERTVGMSPMATRYWYYDMLTAAMKDRSTLHDDWQIDHFRDKHVASAKLRDTLYKDKVSLDPEAVTADDMMLIHSLVSGQGYTDSL